MGTYITTSGAVKKTLAEIKTELEVEFQTVFGNDIDLDASGAFGQIIGIFSKYLAEVWDAWEEMYTARNPDQATGVNLDNIIIENAMERLAATYTTVEDVLLYGDEGTFIIAGKKARKPLSDVNFELDTGITITKAIARIGIIEVDAVTPGNTNTVTINTIDYSYVAGGGDTKTDVLDAIAILIVAGTWVGAAVVASEQLTLTDLDLDFSFDITGDLTIVNIASAGNFTCDTIGVQLLPANSLTEIVTPIVGWDSIINHTVGTTGRATETDEEVRIRREFSVNNGFGSDYAIREAIINDVSGVTICTVTSNRLDVIDSESRTPHSFEAVVQGGDEDEIAEKILEVQPAGIASYGNTTVNVTDSQGYVQIVYFSRPENQYIWIRVTRTLYSEEEYPDGGDDLIKESILNWSLDANNITVGKDVIRQRLAIPIYVIPGIEDIVIEIDATDNPGDPPVYASSNLVMTGRQLPIFALSRMTIL